MTIGQQVAAMRAAVKATLAFRERADSVDRMWEMCNTRERLYRAFDVGGICPETRAYGPDCPAWQRVQDALYRVVKQRDPARRVPHDRDVSDLRR